MDRTDVFLTPFRPGFARDPTDPGAAGRPAGRGFLSAPRTAVTTWERRTDEE